MNLDRKIKVLIVDDSLVFREIMARGIASDNQIEVVAKAVDPFDARDQIIKYKPDVMICDIEMPKMNGIEFIVQLLPQYPIPVIVVSSTNTKVFDALEAGAVDFVTKPNMQLPTKVEVFIQEMIVKVKGAVKAKVTRISVNKTKVENSHVVVGGVTDKRKVIAIGASTGGTEAIYAILKSLPATTPGIVIVQHIPPVFSKMFAERLNEQTKLTVKEAKTGDYVEPGSVLIAPGNMHMKLVKAGNRYQVQLFEGVKVNGHCPSVDILFDSVAKEAGNNAIGIILTGMGYDGARGLLAMRRKGAKTIGQDEKSCVVYGMPKVAYEVGAVERQVDLKNIDKVLYSLLQ